jgi:5-methylcytosine-specific restriction endonuclease McrA
MIKLCDEIKVYKVINGLEILIRVESSTTKTKKEKYADFLQSDKWKSIRKNKFNKSKKRCAICQSKDELHTHHLFYRDNWAETKSGDLRMLCATCHNMVHEAIKIKLLASKPRNMKSHTIHEYFKQMCFVIKGMIRTKTADEQMNRLDEEAIIRASLPYT